MRVSPSGMGALKLDMVKLVPSPNTKSVFFRSSAAISVPEEAPAPRASLWLSGKALLPAKVVITGTLASSASSISSSVASA